MFANEESGEYRRLVERIAAGSELAASPKLQKFLHYVTECALTDRPEAVTEQQIGVHVFGKRAGYNSSEDSVVRSQARLLRMKLANHFQHEGRSEPVVIVIPKGQYLPTFVSRQQLHDVTDELAVHEDLHETTDSRHGRRVFLWGAVAASLVLFVAGLLLGLRWQAMRTSRMVRQSALWRPFLEEKDGPLVIYSNPAFVGTPFSGLKLKLRENPAASIADDAADVDETYTGTGEAQAVYAITRFFDDHGATFTLKRTRLVTWDEARSRSLIFLGAPSQNTALQDLPATTTFRIRLDEGNLGYIENERPQGKEPASFTQKKGSEEYAIIALLPGPNPEKRVLIFSGLTTNGTQAAAEYACSDRGARELVNAAGAASGTVRPFEAILRVRVGHGVPIGAELAALHLR